MSQGIASFSYAEASFPLKRQSDSSLDSSLTFDQTKSGTGSRNIFQIQNSILFGEQQIAINILLPLIHTDSYNRKSLQSFRSSQARKSLASLTQVKKAHESWSPKVLRSPKSSPALARLPVSGPSPQSPKLYNTELTLAAMEDDMPTSRYNELRNGADAETLREQSYVSTRDSMPSDDTMASRSSVASDFGNGDGNDASASTVNKTKDRTTLRDMIDKMVVSFNGRHQCC